MQSRERKSYTSVHRSDSLELALLTDVKPRSSKAAAFPSPHVRMGGKKQKKLTVILLSFKKNT